MNNPETNKPTAKKLTDPDYDEAVKEPEVNSLVKTIAEEIPKNPNPETTTNDYSTETLNLYHCEFEVSGGNVMRKKLSIEATKLFSKVKKLIGQIYVDDYHPLKDSIAEIAAACGITQCVAADTGYIELVDLAKTDLILEHGDKVHNLSTLLENVIKRAEKVLEYSTEDEKARSLYENLVKLNKEFKDAKFPEMTVAAEELAKKLGNANVTAVKNLGDYDEATKLAKDAAEKLEKENKEYTEKLRNANMTITGTVTNKVNEITPGAVESQVKVALKNETEKIENNTKRVEKLEQEINDLKKLIQKRPAPTTGTDTDADEPPKKKPKPITAPGCASEATKTVPRNPKEDDDDNDSSSNWKRQPVKSTRIVTRLKSPEKSSQSNVRQEANTTSTKRPAQTTTKITHKEKKSESSASTGKSNERKSSSGSAEAKTKKSSSTDKSISDSRKDLITIPEGQKRRPMPDLSKLTPEEKRKKAEKMDLKALQHNYRKFECINQSVAYKESAANDEAKAAKSELQLRAEQARRSNREANIKDQRRGESSSKQVENPTEKKRRSSRDPRKEK